MDVAWRETKISLSSIYIFYPFSLVNFIFYYNLWIIIHGVKQTLFLHLLSPISPSKSSNKLGDFPESNFSQALVEKT